MAKPPRGLRNNNPLNLRRSDSQWLGKIPFDKSTDRDFEQFDTMWHGIRAAVKNVFTHIKRDPSTTVKKEIERWAPPTENDTALYTLFVIGKAKLSPNWQLTAASKNAICRMLWAMSIFENGQEIPYRDFEMGYEMAVSPLVGADNGIV